MKDSYNCIIIDDDELDRLTIYAFARKYAFLNITGVFDSAENDGKRYLTIYITKNDIEYEYTFQYPGTEDEWANSKESVISIAYAYDDKGNGGSDGHGDFNFHWFLKRHLTGIFEGEFIDKVDKRLGKKHMVAD